MSLLDTLLLVGGPDSDRSMLRELLQHDYNLLEAEGPEQGLFLLEENRDCIAAILVDSPLPRDPQSSSIYAERSRRIIGDTPLIAVLTPSDSGQSEELALALGVTDVVSRLAPPAIIRHRVIQAVDSYRNRRQLRIDLEEKLETVRHTNEVMVDALSSIIEYRSAESGSHILRIRRFTEILLNEVAANCPEYDLTPDTIRIISSAAALHDIGKVSIPDHILNKPGKLTDEEMEIMKTHTTNGSEMIRTLEGVTSDEYLRYAYNICRSHHERWTGGGYPDGLKGDEIPICAQVVGLADVFDALTTDRVYKKAIPATTAVNMILNGDCGKFSPTLINCFKQASQACISMAKEYAAGRSPKEDDLSLPLPQNSLGERGSDANSLLRLQSKYETLLHYTGATVIEVDMDSSLFHVVYNPLPNFQPLPNLFPIEDALDAAALNNIHPDDVELSQKEYHFFTGDFFTQGLRRHSFSQRIYSSALGDYREYRVSMLRLNIGDPCQRRALLIWQPVTPLPVLPNEIGHNIIQENKALLLLQSNVICRRNDRGFTIVRGSGNLLDLTGYSQSEISELFEDRFLDLILPEDRESFRDHVAQTLRTGDKVESEYRIRRKDGDVAWILEQGCMIADDDGSEYFYGSLLDNSASHNIQAKLEDALRLTRLVINQSDDIIFEWDLTNGQVDLSPGWKTTLGYEPVIIPNKEALSLSRIHPDDIAAVAEAGSSVRSSAQSSEAEFRIADDRNHYVWFRMRLTGLSDAQGETRRALGTLTNIDKTKRAYLALQERAEQDALTGLLNKASTQATIRDILDAENADACALMMIDLDNFKFVNDRFGHLFGDTVLMRTAQLIRRLFRGGDIIGRVGGDEFMILMKDVSDRQLVQERCQLLIDELRRLLLQEEEEEEVRRREISCSIGVALAPEHGRSFHDLFLHADQALYHSKQSGRSCFTFYEENLNLSTELASTPIDSNDQPDLSSSGLVRAVFRQLSQSTDVEKTVQQILEMIGQRTNVSRIYIFENNDENTHCSNTFEWCNEGILPEIDNLQNISYETDIPGWENNYDENGILFCTDISQLSPSARAILEPQGIKSMLHCGIYENGVFRGYAGLDECTINRVWTQEQVELLTFLGEVVTSFLLKKRSQDRAIAAAANLGSILNSQHNWMYVIDPETYQLRYLNDKTHQTVPTLKVGDVCYEGIMGLKAPCESCPMAKMDASGFARSRIFSPAAGISVVNEAHSIIWDGENACLISCREPDESQHN